MFCECGVETNPHWIFCPLCGRKCKKVQPVKKFTNRSFVCRRCNEGRTGIRARKEDGSFILREDPVYCHKCGSRLKRIGNQKLSKLVPGPPTTRQLPRVGNERLAVIYRSHGISGAAANLLARSEIEPARFEGLNNVDVDNLLGNYRGFGEQRTREVLDWLGI